MLGEKVALVTVDKIELKFKIVILRVTSILLQVAIVQSEVEKIRDLLIRGQGQLRERYFNLKFFLRIRQKSPRKATSVVLLFHQRR